MKKLFLFFLAMPCLVHAQTGRDTILNDVNLQACIHYALQHQPLVQQSLIDEQITENTIRTKLADWYPQLNFGYNFLHYFELPTSFTTGANGNKIPFKAGISNTSALQFSANQNICSRDLLLAKRTASDIRE